MFANCGSELIKTCNEDGISIAEYTIRYEMANGTPREKVIKKMQKSLSVMIKSSSYAMDNEENELGVRCMAVGIRDDHGKLIAGLSISAPADRLDEQWLPKLKATAASISEAMGYPG